MVRRKSQEALAMHEPLPENNKVPDPPNGAQTCATTPVEEDNVMKCSSTALVPVLDIYSVQAVIGGVETALERRLLSLEERLTKKIKDRDWRLMERIRQLQEQQKQNRPWWRRWIG